MRSKFLILAILATVSANLQAQAAETESYRARITALNVDKIGSTSVGEALFTIKGDNLEVRINMSGVPANIEHWEHFHGFPDGRNDTCVTQNMDANKDGYIDLGETEKPSGTTMVPFNDKPEEMVIPTNTYPHASAKGDFEYTKNVPLKQLAETFGRTYSGGTIDLDKRVIYVHGVASDSHLPSSVSSLGTVPSHVTIPIACGKIEKRS